MGRVAVTGMGAITPLGNSIEEFWKNIVLGVSGAGPITKFNCTKFKTQFAHEVKHFNVLEYIEQKEIKKYDLFTQYAIAATDQAIADSALDFNSMSMEMRCDVGVIWASGNGGISTLEEQLANYYTKGEEPRFSPYMIPKTIADIAAGVLSIRYGLHGPNFATLSACASSNTAIISACDIIRLGKAKIMLVGGSEAAITPAAVGGFNSSHALSTRNDSPNFASRPFDTERDGFVMGEGAGTIILEDWDHAIARGAHIYAEVVGGGMAADAYHLTGTPINGYGAEVSMRKAMADAKVLPDDIDYINAHATSTQMGDLSELNAIKAIFGKKQVAISSTKSMTGHLLGAAGVVESIVCILALKNSVVPATINTVCIDPKIPEGMNLILGKIQSLEIKYAMNNTFGFGGHTATTVFKKHNHLQIV